MNEQCFRTWFSVRNQKFGNESFIRIAEEFISIHLLHHFWYFCSGLPGFAGGYVIGQSIGANITILLIGANIRAKVYY